MSFPFMQITNWPTDYFCISSRNLMSIKFKDFDALQKFQILMILLFPMFGKFLIAWRSLSNEVDQNLTFWYFCKILTKNSSEDANADFGSLILNQKI